MEPWLGASNPSMKINSAVLWGTELFGIVMLLKPKVPISPVTMNDSPVAVALFTAIITLDICVLVMFPLRVSLTVFPLSVVAVTVAFACAAGVGVGIEVGVCVGVLFEEPNAKRIPSSKHTHLPMVT